MPAKIKGLLDIGVKPIYELETEDGKKIRTTGNHPYLVKLKSISNSSVLNMGNFNSSGFNENKFNSIVTNSQSKLLEFSSPQFLYLTMLKRMGQLTNLFDFINNPFLFFNRQASQLLFSSGMEEISQHENNYLENFIRFLSRLSTSFAESQEFSRSASATLSSVSLIASGVDHSIKSIISSNNSLGRNFVGAITPRRFLSSTIVNGNSFAIQDNNSKDENDLSSAKWTKVAYLNEGDEIAVADLKSGFEEVPKSNFGTIKFVKIAKKELLEKNQIDAGNAQPVETPSVNGETLGVDEAPESTPVVDSPEATPTPE